MSTRPESKSSVGRDVAEQDVVEQDVADAPAASVDETMEPKSKKPLGYDPDELQTRLKPHLSPKLAMGLPQLGITAIFCLLFFAFSFLGLRPLDVYTQVAYGDWILSNGTLPTADPFLELAAGMPVDNSAWLSQVIIAGAYRLAGGEALSALFSVLKVAVFVLFGVAVFLRSRNLLFVAAGVLALGLAYGLRILDAPLDIFGQLAFAALLLFLTIDELKSAKRNSDTGEVVEESAFSKFFMWIAVPLLFVLWVNLHLSFVFGLIVMTAWALGTAWDTCRTERSLSSAFGNPVVRRRIWLAELAFLATLANPALLGAWTQAFRTATDANLRDQLQYAWLSFARYEGLVLAGSLLLTMFLLRASKSFGGVDFLAWLGLAIATGCTVFATPYLALAVVILASGHFAKMCCCGASPELMELGGDAAPKAEESKKELPADAMLAEEDDDEEFVLPEGRSFVYSLLCVLLIWLAVMFTPTYDMVASPKEKQRGPAQLLGAAAPWQVAEYLKANPLRGRILAPIGWSAYLQLETRPEEGPHESRYFANSMTNHLPRRAWEDYMSLAGAGRGWETALERYDIRHVIVDKETQATLANGLRNSEDWGIRYEDDVTLVASLLVRSPQSHTSSQDAGDNPSADGGSAAGGNVDAQ